MKGFARAFAEALSVLCGKPTEMIEPPGERDPGDVGLVACMDQFATYPIEADFAKQLHGRDAVDALELVIERAHRNAGDGAQHGHVDRLLGVAFEELADPANRPGLAVARAAGGPGGGPGGGMGGLLDAAAVSDEVTKFLEDGKDGFTWALATIGANNAAGYQLATGDPVMPIGGFNGTDDWPTLEAFQQLVDDGAVHYFLAGGGGAPGGGPGGGSGSSSAISEWVTTNFTTEDVDGLTFYDLTQPTAG